MADDVERLKRKLGDTIKEARKQAAKIVLGRRVDLSDERREHIDNWIQFSDDKMRSAFNYIDWVVESFDKMGSLLEESEKEGT